MEEDGRVGSWKLEVGTGDCVVLVGVCLIWRLVGECRVAFVVRLLDIRMMGYGVWSRWREARVCFSDLICDLWVEWVQCALVK